MNDEQKYCEDESKPNSLPKQDKQKDLRVIFAAVSFDSKLNVDGEEQDINRKEFDFHRSALTFSAFEKLLIDAPHAVHITTYANHFYKDTNKQNEFQISFEEPQTLRYLIDEQPNYSAYYAVIAILFEMEICHFVSYGLSKNLKQRKKLKTFIWANDKFTLLRNRKIYAMLCTLLCRFGCDFKYNPKHGCIEIFYGKRENKKYFDSYCPIKEYQLSALLKHDDNVQEILRKIERDYNNTLRNNVRITKSLKKHQLFAWEILCVLLNRTLIENNAEPDDKDDTQWFEEMAENKENETADVDDDDAYGTGYTLKELRALPIEEIEELRELVKIPINYMDDEKDEFSDTDSDFFEDDGSRTTQIKFGKIQDLTREIKIVPILNEGEYEKMNLNEQQLLIQRVNRFKNKVVKTLKKVEHVQIILDFQSISSTNVHIIRFKESYSLSKANEKVKQIKINPKYNQEYNILFRPISKSDDATKHQVGYIKGMQEKNYCIDIKNKTDPISLSIKKHLKSKKECKIKLIVLNGCHSYILGKIFSEYVENVICINPYVKIWDSTATTFAKAFYSALPSYTKPSVPFKDSVFRSFLEAKQQITQIIANDNACNSHSHSKECNGQDFKEDDEQTLIVCNIDSEKNMEQIVSLINDATLTKYGECILERYTFQKDEHYEELSCVFLRFKNKEYRRIGMDILSQKQYDEELLFSQHILLSEDEEKKESEMESYNALGLGWDHRVLSRCCCNAHYPRLAQDKLLLIQNENIINRNIMYDLSLLKKELDKMKQCELGLQLNSNNNEQAFGDKPVKKKANKF